MKKKLNKLIKIYKKHEEVINYLIVGGLTTVISLLTYYGCVYTIFDPNDPIELQNANIISWICAVTFAYFTNRIFVFKSKNEKKFKEAIKFYISRVASLILDVEIMYVLVICLNQNDKISKLLVQFIIIIVNYLFSKLFVFKKN